VRHVHAVARAGNRPLRRATGGPTVTEPCLEDLRASDPVERLLEDSWDTRSEHASRRELITEGTASVVFLAVAVPFGASALAGANPRLGALVLLIALYAVVARMIRFPVGAGYIVPSYLVLVPMLLLLPPMAVPLAAAAGLALGTLVRWITGRARAEQLLFAVPDAWHAFGPALVLALAARVHGVSLAGVYLVAFAAGCVVDLLVSTAREAVSAGVAPRLQLRVIATVWLVDACFAPLGLLVARGGREQPALLLLILPLTGLLLVADRDRNARIAEAHRRLRVVARQRTRLQAAVSRFGDALAAKLDLEALATVILGGSIDALDASAGRLALDPPTAPQITKFSGRRELGPLLELASAAVGASQRAHQLERDGAWALAVPFVVGPAQHGTLAVARRDRAFSDDEHALIGELVERARSAAEDIIAHARLREQAQTDPLTSLGNRRKLALDLSEQLANASRAEPLLLMLFDLDGFKSYNDTFGHVAGDSLLSGLGHRLATAVSETGSAYRLGGDEFCVLLPARGDLQQRVKAVAAALEERGQTFTVAASCGSVLLPHEASTTDYALQLADKRMYTHKHGRRSGAREQAHDVLIHILRAKQNGLPGHSTGVTRLAAAIGRRMGMNAEELDELTRAAALHDIGKVGIPDAILAKPGPLDAQEWDFIRQHTVLGERILSAAPALRPIATIVRATHERWDGRGYPDGMRATEIPLAARIIAVCDAYDAIINHRCYRPAETPDAARQELKREAGHQFDPAVVTTFLAELDRSDQDPRDDPTPPHHALSPDRHTALATEIATHVREMLGPQEETQQQHDEQDRRSHNVALASTSDFAAQRDSTSPDHAPPPANARSLAPQPSPRTGVSATSTA
jgi:diguanylate cyclase (GGDEF)-like protein